MPLIVTPVSAAWQYLTVELGVFLAFAVIHALTTRYLSVTRERRNAAQVLSLCGLFLTLRLGLLLPDVSGLEDKGMAYLEQTTCASSTPYSNRKICRETVFSELSCEEGIAWSLPFSGVPIAYGCTTPASWAMGSKQGAIRAARVFKPLPYSF